MKLAAILRRRAIKEAVTAQDARTAYRDLVLALATDQDPGKLNSHLGSDDVTDKLLERLAISSEQLQADVQRAEECQRKVRAEQSLPDLTGQLSTITGELAKRQAELEKVIAKHQEVMNPIRFERGGLEYSIDKAKDQARIQIEYEEYPAEFVASLAQIAGLRQSSSRQLTRLHAEVMSIDRKVLDLESELEASTINVEKSELAQQLEQAKATQSALCETQIDWQNRQAGWAAAEDEVRGMVCPETGLFIASKTANEVFADVSFRPLRLPLSLDN